VWSSGPEWENKTGGLLKVVSSPPPFFPSLAIFPGASNPSVGGAQPQPDSSLSSEVAGTLPPNFTLANTKVRESRKKEAFNT
jgi:hypothetical protein